MGGGLAPGTRLVRVVRMNGRPTRLRPADPSTDERRELSEPVRHTTATGSVVLFMTLSTSSKFEVHSRKERSIATLKI